MAELTKEDIESWREWARRGQRMEFGPLNGDRFITLCDLALRALSTSPQDNAAQNSKPVDARPGDIDRVVGASERVKGPHLPTPSQEGHAAACQHERLKTLRLSDRTRARWRALPPGGRAECWCCHDFYEEIGLFRSFNICRTCWEESDPAPEKDTRKSVALGAFAGPARAGAMEDVELERAQLHGPDLRTIDALNSALMRMQAAERDFIQVHRNCIEARERAERAEAGLAEAKRDAERYRWLNRQYEFLAYIRGQDDVKHYRLRCGEPLDRWIDDAIKREQKAIIDAVIKENKDE